MGVRFQVPGSSHVSSTTISRVWRVLKDHPEAVIVGLGVFLRLFVYLSGRPFWMDEASLWGNLAHKPILDFSEPMTGDQLAPMGFLIAQRALMSVLGVSRYAARLLPLVSGVISILLFARLARRILAPRAALIALTLFCFSDDLIYYASELKPYSLDLAVGLAISLAALGVLAQPVSARGAARLGAMAIAASWCSFPSAFVVAGCGATLILSTLISARPRDAAVWSAVGVAWVASFFLSYRASMALLSPYTTMYLFWDFAFLPVWPLPMDRGRLEAGVGILLEIFVTPLNLVAPFWPRLGVILPVGLLFLGVWSLARRSWREWAILVMPVALAIFASALRRYPLHGRLILELVPALLLLIADGAETVRSWEKGRIKPGFIVVLILLFAYPCFAAFTNAASVRRARVQPAWRYSAESIYDLILPSLAVQKVGITIFSPPFRADSWAHRPTMVQLAEVVASGKAGRSPLTAERKACTRWGCDPPWPPPCRNERWSAS